MARGDRCQPELLHDAARPGADGHFATASGSSVWWSIRTSLSPAPARKLWPSWRRRSELTSQGRRRLRASTRTRSAFNILPEIDVFLDNGYSREEWKVVTESRKILHLPELRISCTAVRVPVFVSHSEAVHVETSRPMTPEEARRAFASVPGVVVMDDPAEHLYPTPVQAAGKDEIYVGRVRTDPSVERGLAFWVVSDNLRKGARDQCGADRRSARGARLGESPISTTRAHQGRGSIVTDAERQAALDVIGAEVGGLPLAAGCIRPGRWPCPEKARLPRRSSSWARDRDSTRIGRGVPS